MMFPDFDPERQFRAAWESVTIERSVPYTLFTFGDSDLPYYLVVAGDESGTDNLVRVSRGCVKVTRPLLYTAQTATPELRNFFESDDELEGLATLLMARSAAFQHLRLENQSGQAQFVSDSVEEVVARLNRQLDAEDEDRVGILTAPSGMGSMAVLKYTAERILQSAPGNLQELRERGLLPE